jgi:hypothetical protein
MVMSYTVNSFVGHSLMLLLRVQRRLVAALILMVITTLCVSMDCHAVGPRDSGLHATESADHHFTEPADTPCCPIDGHDHTDIDHCASCLHCVCNALLAATAPILTYAPALSSLNLVDRFNTLPEVYLPIFIPPQNLS